MDLFAKTIIVPSKIILNNEYLPHNLKPAKYKGLVSGDPENVQ